MGCKSATLYLTSRIQILMAKQPPREDLFTPIHKGIRSMIYDLGTKLQKVDYADPSATGVIVSQLKQNLQSANMTCIICMLHEHASNEEQSIFPQIAPHDSKLVEALIQAHVEITKQVSEISKAADELLQLKNDEQRIEMGAKLNVMVNNLFAFYLAHLNNEEATILPLTWKYLTDEQMRELRARIEMATPPERYAQWMSWILRSLNVNELTGMFSGMKMGAPPPVLEKMKHIAEESVDHDTWNKVKSRVNLT
jgi:hemerythrin superfamily protein